MYLTPSNIVHFLMERGLATPEAIVAGDCAVTEIGRRCRNFKVVLGARTGFFVKQPRSRGGEADATLRREAALYRLVPAEAQLRPLCRVLPRFVDFDEGRSALVVELLPEGENLNELHFRLKRFPPEVGELLGRGLGAYHSAATGMALAPVAAGLFPRQLPWLFALRPGTLAPLDSFPATVGPPLVAMLAARPGLLAHLWGLGAAYRFDTLVHGDMKWDNVVVFRDEDEDAHDFRVIDWELCDLGDAAWDIASVFASYLIYLSMAPDWAAGDSRQDLTLGDATGSIARFWAVYCQTLGVAPEAAAPLLQRCVAYVAGRLVLSVFEGLINATLAMDRAEALMTLAANIAAAPQRAAAQLLGREAGA